jgi:hypothetical protein
MLFVIFFAGLIADLTIDNWWSIVPISFIAAFYFRNKVRNIFWTGFFANALLWLIFILYKSIPNGNLLAEKISVMYRLPHFGILVILIVMIGGLLSGISANCGAFFYDLLKDMAQKRKGFTN